MGRQRDLSDYNGAMLARALELAPPPELSPSEKLRVALEMAGIGIEMKRRSLRRADPDAPPEVLEERLRQWLAGP